MTSRIEQMVADLHAARADQKALEQFLDKITLERWETDRVVKNWWCRIFRKGDQVIVRGLGDHEQEIGHDLRHLFGEFLQERVRAAKVRVREAEAALTEIDPQAGDRESCERGGRNTDWCVTHQQRFDHCTQSGDLS